MENRADCRFPHFSAKQAFSPTTPPSSSALLLQATPKRDGLWRTFIRAPRATAGLVQSPTVPRIGRNPKRSGLLPPTARSQPMSAYPQCADKPRRFRPGRHYPDSPSPGSLDAMLVLQTTRALTSIRSFPSRRVHSAMSLAPLNTPTLRHSFTAPWKTMRTRYGPPGVTNIG